MPFKSAISTILRALGLTVFFCSLCASAQTEESINLNDGELEIPISRYDAFAESAPILLWLPSSRGTSNRQAITASALGDIDVETWIVDLHMGYFVDPGRSSIAEFEAQDIAALIDIAAKRTDKKIYLIATDLVAKPTLEGVAHYQQAIHKNKQVSKLGGVILFHPNLSIPSNTPGTASTFHAIATHSTAPIYYIQPSISTRQWRSGEIIDALEQGGSSVFFHPMPNISAGYHLRPDDDLSEADMRQRERLAPDLKRAIRLLAMQKTPPAPTPIVSNEPEVKLGKSRYGLRKLNDRTALPLSLLDMQSASHKVSYAQHKLSLLSFWASWCEPCIKELPALRRLNDDFANKGLNIITINVGETVEEIQRAISTFNMQPYTNLLDPEGITMKAWNVYGFPTNFLVSQNGELALGSFGAVDWDDEKVRALLDKML